jgi:hypothetical protein
MRRVSCSMAKKMEALSTLPNSPMGIWMKSAPTRNDAWRFQNLAVSEESVSLCPIPGQATRGMGRGGQVLGIAADP